MKLFTNKQKKQREIHSRDSSSSLRQPTTFRRNRTLSAPMAGSKSPRTSVHNLANKRRKILSILLVIVALIIVIQLLIFNFTTSPFVVVSGNSLLEKVNPDRYSKAIQDYLEIKPLERLSFLLNQEKLSIYVSNKLPEVEKVRLSKERKVGSASFRVTMRKPVAGWLIDGKKYYVDANGVTFEKNHFTEPTVQIIDNTGAPVQSGTMSVSKRLLGFVGLVVSTASEYGYNVTEAALPVSTMRELDVTVEGSGYPIKLSIDRPVGEQIEDMSRALSYFTANSISPEYIDVRVENKAYYK